jgi:hypothetical protein
VARPIFGGQRTEVGALLSHRDRSRLSGRRPMWRWILYKAYDNVALQYHSPSIPSIVQDAVNFWTQFNDQNYNKYWKTKISVWVYCCSTTKTIILKNKIFYLDLLLFNDKNYNKYWKTKFSTWIYFCSTTKTTINTEKQNVLSGFIAVHCNSLREQIKLKEGAFHNTLHNFTNNAIRNSLHLLVDEKNKTKIT